MANQPLLRKQLRWFIVILVYTSQIWLLIYSFNDEALWQFVIEPVILVECFIALGLLASDYLTPSLSQISRDILHISDKVSGVTLLALGNSIPDITGTYQAMNNGSISLALGELLGGIFFLLTVVLGIMALIRPIELRRNKIMLSDADDEFGNLNGPIGVIYDRNTFMQDIGMFGALILMSAIFISDGRLMFWECIIMVTAYCSYTSVIIFRDRNSLCNDDLLITTSNCRNVADDLSTIISNSVQTSSNEQNILLFNSGTSKRRANIKSQIRHYLRSRYQGWVKITLADCFEVWESGSKIRNVVDTAEENSVRSTEDQIDYDCGLPLRRTTSLQDANRAGKVPTIRTTVNDSYNDGNSNTKSAASSMYALNSDTERLHIPMRPKTQKSLSSDCIPILPLYHDNEILCERSSRMVHSSPEEDKVLATWPQDLKLLRYMLEESMYLPTTEFLVLLLTTPVTIFLSFQIPYLGHINRSGKLHIFEVIRLLLAPAIVSFMLVRSIPIWTLAISFSLGGILTYRYHTSQVRFNKEIVATAGFILSLSFVYSCVHVVVTILTDWSTKLNVSPSILGLTIFAWGNSVGDLVSNAIFIDIGVIELALGACFGSPLLYFVFGVGIDGMILILRQNNYDQKSLLCRQLDYVVDSHLVYTAFGILVAFLTFVIAVPINKWRIDKKITIFLLLLYVSITCMNVLQEMY